MAYDRYVARELSHGCVIDRQLWEAVQVTVQRIAGPNQGKRTAVHRVNPLVGLLKYKDGSSFGGTGAWGGAGRLNYYYNAKHKIRLKAEALEEIAAETVSKMIDETPELRDALRRRGAQTTNALQLLAGEIERQRLALAEVQRRQDALDKRLDFLLKDGELTDAESFRQDYATERARLKAERDGIEQTIHRLSGQKHELEADAFDWRTLGGNARKVLGIIGEHDPVALKNAYQGLFEAVVVGEMDGNGVRPLEFIAKDGNAPAAFVAAEAISSDTLNLG